MTESLDIKQADVIIVDFKFQRKSLNSFSDTKRLNELEKAAKTFNYIEFGRDDFDKVANISAGVVRKHFGGSWKKALTELKPHLNKKGLSLKPRPHHPNRVLSDKALFDELERIWKIIGQRPSQAEWEKANPKYSYATYKKRFNGWKNACLKFIEYKSGSTLVEENILQKTKLSEKRPKEQELKNKRDKRDISLKLRLKVLYRDNFRCVFCGRSPALNPGVNLHIDHIKPFSKGGKTTLENLQTLCQECNLGKSNQNLS